MSDYPEHDYLGQWTEEVAAEPLPALDLPEAPCTVNRAQACETCAMAPLCLPALQAVAPRQPTAVAGRISFLVEIPS